MSNCTLTKRLSLYDALDATKEMIRIVDDSIRNCLDLHDFDTNQRVLVTLQSNVAELECIFKIAELLGIKQYLLEYTKETPLLCRLETIERKLPQCWVDTSITEWPLSREELSNDLREDHIRVLFDVSKEEYYEETYVGAIFRISVIKLCNLLKVNWWEYEFE